MVYLEMEKWVGGQERPLLAGLHIPNGIYFPKTKMYVYYAVMGVNLYGAYFHIIQEKKKEKKLVLARYFHLRIQNEIRRY